MDNQAWASQEDQEDWARDELTVKFRLLMERRLQDRLSKLLAACRSSDIGEVRRLVGRYDEILDTIPLTQEPEQNEPTE